MAVVETKQIPVTAGIPIDVSADVDLVPPEKPVGLGTQLFVENTGLVLIYFRETVAAPAATDTGHQLGAGASAQIRVVAGCPFWFWVVDAGTAELTISAAAPTTVLSGGC